MTSRGESSSSAGDAVSNSQFEEFMVAMKSVQDQMTTMARTLTDEREVVDEQLVKKMCFDKGVQFKRKAMTNSIVSTRRCKIK